MNLIRVWCNILDHLACHIMAKAGFTGGAGVMV